MVKHLHNGNTRRIRKKGMKEMFEIIMTENFHKLMSDTNPPDPENITETQRTSSRINVPPKNKKN